MPAAAAPAAAATAPAAASFRYFQGFRKIPRQSANTLPHRKRRSTQLR
jgi:hypothetical protein